MRKLVLPKVSYYSLLKKIFAAKYSNKKLLSKDKRYYFLKYFFFSDTIRSYLFKHHYNVNTCRFIIENSSNYRSRAYKECSWYLKRATKSSDRLLWRYFLNESKLLRKFRRRRIMSGKLRKKLGFFLKKELHRFDIIRSYFFCTPIRIVRRRRNLLQILDKFYSFVRTRLEALEKIEEEAKKRKEEEGKQINKDEGEEEEEEEKELKIVHFKPNVVLSRIITDSFIVKKSLLHYKLRFLLNSVIKLDPVFFSFFFNKFIGKAMFAGSKNKFFFLISSVFLLIKFFTALRPFYVFFSSLESSRVVVGHIPKKISGRVQIVPTYLYFGKQIQTAIGLFVRTLRKRQDFISSAAVENVSFKTKRLSRLASLFVKNQKIYFSKLSRYTQRKNSVFDIIKKNYYLYISNRSNLQYRWR